jgi:hypothetical protein
MLVSDFLPLSSLNLSLYRHADRQQSTFPGGDLDSVFTIDSASTHGSDRDWGSVFTMESASIRGSDRDWGSVFASSVHRSSLATFVSVDN